MNELRRIEINEDYAAMSIKTKNDNRSQSSDDKDQEKSNRYWHWSLKVFIKCSPIIFLLSMIITVALSVYLFNTMIVEHFDESEFFVKNGRALRSAERIDKIFGTDKNFRVHQQMRLYPALDIIIKRKLSRHPVTLNDTNMLNAQVIHEIRSLDRQIQSIQINNSINSTLYNYSSICAVINTICVIDGNYILTNRFLENFLNLRLEPHGIYFDTNTGANGIDLFMFGKNYQVSNVTTMDDDYEDEENQSGNDYDVEEKEDDGDNQSGSSAKVSVTRIVSYVPVFRLRYSLNISTDNLRSLSAEWENTALRYLNEKFRSNVISLSVSSSTAVGDAVRKQAHDEGPFTAITVLIFFIFAWLLTSIQGNSHTPIGYISFCGLINLVLSTGATFGLLTILKVKIFEHMALTVLAVAIIECMRISILCGEYHRIVKEHILIPSRTISTKIDIEEVLPLLLKSTGPYFTISTFIQVIVYSLVLLFSTTSCTKYLSIALVLYVAINYITHCTFFYSCLIIILRLMKFRDHYLLCRHYTNDNYGKDRKKSIKVCFQKPLAYLEKMNSTFKTIITVLICLLSILFIVCSTYVALTIDTKLFDDKFLPRNATSLRSYMKSQTDDYELGPVIMYVIPSEIDYSNATVQSAIHRIIEQCHNESTTNTFKLVWLEKENLENILTSRDPISIRVSPYSQNDLIVLEKKNKAVIKSSRFYCQLKYINGSRKDLKTMMNFYRYAEESPISGIFPYSLIFPHYEALQQILVEVYLIVFLVVGISFLLSFGLMSFRISFLILIHVFVVITGYLTCLYIFHDLSINFANATWLFLSPVLFIDTIVHACSNPSKSKWKYNRIIISLALALLVFSLFPIDSYIYHIIRYSLIYQLIICFISINILLPSWNYVTKRILKKNSEKKSPSVENIDKNQLGVELAEIENLVQDTSRNATTSL